MGREGVTGHPGRRSARAFDRGLLRLQTDLIDEQFVIDDCRAELDRPVDRFTGAVARQLAALEIGAA